jgi:hypothetical protein
MFFKMLFFCWPEGEVLDRWQQDAPSACHIAPAGPNFAAT